MNEIMRLLNTAQYAGALEKAERLIYLAAYNYTGGNQSQTARLMGVSRNTFRSKLSGWKISKPTI